MSNKQKKQFSKETLKLAAKYQKQLVETGQIVLKSDDEKDLEEVDDEELQQFDVEQFQDPADEQAEDEEQEEEENDEEQEEQEEDDDDDLPEDDEYLEEEEVEQQQKQQKLQKQPQTKAKKQQVQEEEEEVEEENQESIEQGIQGDQEFEGMTDLNAVMNRINDIIDIMNAKDYSLKNRDAYLKELKHHLCNYYGYNTQLMDVFGSLFQPQELVAFLEANEAPRPITIRVNTLKTRRKELAQTLVQRGVTLDSAGNWTKVGMVVYESKVPIGATPEYLSGHYMLQSASSFLPVLALAPQMNERILDMSAAPGGKTTYIAQLMKNSGVIFANDNSKDREKALFFNLQRLGVTNCIVTNYDGRKFPKVMKNFDRVLLDAPCTGLGIISKDPAIKAQKQLKDILKHSHLQKEMILSAIDCTKKGGIIVYSTCSVSVQENECVLDYAMRNRHVKLVETGLEIGSAGITKFEDRRFDDSMKLAKRIYPHVHNMDGFFFAKFRKIKDGPMKEAVQKEKVVTKKDKRRMRQEARVLAKKVKV